MAYEKEQRRLQQLLDEEGYPSDTACDDQSDSDSEDNIEEHLDSDSNSEQDGDELVPRKKALFVANDGMEWRKHFTKRKVRTREANIVIHLPGVKSHAKSAKTAEECWSLFFSNEMLNIIVENTNKYIDNCSKNYKRERSAKPTDIIEIKALIGLLYMIGALKSSHLNVKEIWDRHSYGIERFWLTMSKERFLFLLRCLRFDDFNTRIERREIDRLAPIRNLFELFVNNCKTSYSMSEFTTIDEQLLAFRGRCIFKQYLPKKPNKYGIKVFALVDAKTWYTSNLEIYLGQQPDGPYRMENSSLEIVERRIGPISQTGRNITCDNWFTTFPLVTKLVNDHKLTYVGTVRKNRIGLPSEFKNTEGRVVGSSMFGFRDKMVLVSYVPKKGKVVLAVSSMHDDDAIDPSTGKETKPELITFYNSTKGGVDTVDKLCENIQRSKKYKKMANGYILFPPQYSRNKFSNNLYCE